MDSGSLSHSQERYIELVSYVKERHAAAPNLALTSHLAAMATSVWHGLLRILSARGLSQLEALGWPKPFKDPLPANDGKFQNFEAAFSDLLALEKVYVVVSGDGQGCG